MTKKSSRNIISFYVTDDSYNLIDSLTKEHNCSVGKIIRFALILVNLYFKGVNFKYVDFDKVLKDC